MNFPALGNDAEAHRLMESLEYVKLAEHLFARAQQTGSQVDFLKALGSLILGKSYPLAKELAVALRSSDLTQTPELARHIFYAYAVSVPQTEALEALQDLVRIEPSSPWLTALQQSLDEDVRTTLLAIDDCAPTILSIHRGPTGSETIYLAVQCRGCSQAYGVPVRRTLLGNSLVPCWHCAHPHVLDSPSIPDRESYLTPREVHTLSSIDHVKRIVIEKPSP